LLEILFSNAVAGLLWGRKAVTTEAKAAREARRDKLAGAAGGDGGSRRLLALCDNPCASERRQRGSSIRRQDIILFNKDNSNHFEKQQRSVSLVTFSTDVC
jgi:hypothetical protein